MVPVAAARGRSGRAAPVGLGDAPGAGPPRASPPDAATMACHDRHRSRSRPTPGRSAPRTTRYNASLVRREDAARVLAYFWVRFDGEPTPFEPGQYMTIGVFVDGRIVQRPYSVASRRPSPGRGLRDVRPARPGRHVHAAAVAACRSAHRMRMIGPKGKFVLQPDDDRTHMFISSGTGNAPFVSMMQPAPGRRGAAAGGLPQRRARTPRPGLPRRCSRTGSATADYPVTYIPTVSRPDDPRNAGWTGRTGRVESIVAPVLDELGLTPANSIAYICGNPDMIHRPRRPCSGAASRRSRSRRSCTGRRARSRAAWRARTWPPPSMRPRRTPTSS